MMSISRQLQKAFVASGLTQQQLLERSGLVLDRTSLFRQLNGETSMKTEVAEAVARALGLTALSIPTGEAA